MPPFKRPEEYVQEQDQQTPAAPVAAPLDVESIVKAAVQAALEATKYSNNDAPSIANAITQAFAENSQALHGIRKITANERKPTSVFNPTGKRGRKLDRVYRVNGYVLDPRYLFDVDYALLAQIKEGRFVGKRVTVTVIDNENPEAINVLISYPERTVEDRMENKGIWRNFTGMLQLVVAEQNKLVVA